MSEETENAETLSNEWVARIYSNAADNIFFIKKQEWIITGYAISVDVAIVLAKAYLPMEYWVQLGLTLVAAVSAVFGVAVLWIFYRGLVKFRARMDTLYE